ncbi:MAG: ion channel [Rudaea sp.]
MIRHIANLAALSASAQPRNYAAADYSNWGADCAVVIITAIAVCVCVFLHYEVLNILSQRLARLQGQHRRRVLFGIFGVLSVHIVEIWIFGLTFALLSLWQATGSLQGIAGGLLDHVYVSAMTFTTVGTGDAYLIGPIRFLAGTEALTGLVLITWSASFTFLEMQRFWRDR